MQLAFRKCWRGAHKQSLSFEFWNCSRYIHIRLEVICVRDPQVKYVFHRLWSKRPSNTNLELRCQHSQMVYIIKPKTCRNTNSMLAIIRIKLKKNMMFLRKFSYVRYFNTNFHWGGGRFYLTWKWWNKRNCHFWIMCVSYTERPVHWFESANKMHTLHPSYTWKLWNTACHWGPPGTSFEGCVMGKEVVGECQWAFTIVCAGRGCSER